MKYFVGLLVVAVALTLLMYALFPSLGSQVILKAKPWNDGNVHIWHTLVEAEATFTDVREGTRCQRLDNLTHKLIGPPPPIFYYHVACDGVRGYVEVDQVR